MEIDEVFLDARDKGLISFQHQGDWLEQAIQQHNPRVTIMLARTEPIPRPKLDKLDFAILYLDRNN